MKQRIEIRNFGPIKKVDLDISDYTLFIGPNASGKSTIAKLVYFFQTTKTLVYLNQITSNVNSGTLEARTHDQEVSIRDHFLSLWDIQALQDDFQVNYFHELHNQEMGHALSLKKVNNTLSITLSGDYLQYIRDAFTRAATHHDPISKAILEESLPLIAFKEYRRTKRSLFIPAGRQFLSLRTDDLPLFNPGRIEPLVEEFMVLVSKTKKNSFHKFIQEEVNEIDLYNKDQEPEDQYNLSEIKLAIALSAKILKGNYINTREGERIYFHEKHFVKLYEASSGQQEALWIINLIYLLLWKDAFSSELFTNFTIIEEPEAHLYPETQRDVTNLISLLANQPGNQVMITTHSPYILSALNNLLYAHKAGKTKPDEVSEIVDPLLWLNLSPDRVAAYKVENGEIHDIIDPELGMINAEEIDSASRTIFDELDKILQLED